MCQMVTQHGYATQNYSPCATLIGSSRERTAMKRRWFGPERITSMAGDVVPGAQQEVRPRLITNGSSRQPCRDTAGGLDILREISICHACRRHRRLLLRCCHGQDKRWTTKQVTKSTSQAWRSSPTETRLNSAATSTKTRRSSPRPTSTQNHMRQPDPTRRRRRRGGNVGDS